MSKRGTTTLAIACIITCSVLGFVFYWPNAKTPESPPDPPTVVSSVKGKYSTVKVPGKYIGPSLEVLDQKVGTGPSPRKGQSVTVHYTGWLADGTKFDSSLDRGQPFTFLFDSGQVIRGWDSGLADMKVGGKRRLIIPPQLAYGERGAGGIIPANSTLTFDVEMLTVN